MSVFIARQPIFDAQLDVFAYELLFRQGNATEYNSTDGNCATASVLTNAFGSAELGELTGQRPYFINFTESLLLSNVASLFPADRLYVEVLEDCRPLPEIIAACSQLRESGYTLVLDDFLYRPELEPLVQMADIIKVDFLLADADERRKTAERCRELGIPCLAEKVETAEEFQQAREMGYSLFQGFFFSKPSMYAVNDMPANRANSLQLLHELNQENSDIGQMESIIRRDVALSFKLLRLINSAAFALRRDVDSIRQALALLGMERIRRWASLVALSEAGQGLPDELVRMTLIRAFFCERLARACGREAMADNAFLMGSFSFIDTFFARPIEQVLEEIALNQSVKDALLGEFNDLGKIYRALTAYEQGDWAYVRDILEALGLDDPKGIGAIYTESVRQSQEMLAQIQPPQ